MLNSTHLALCEGDNGIPLWSMFPTIDNISQNTVITFLEPYELCIILFEFDNGTCFVIYNGFIAFAVTECLNKTTCIYPATGV